MNIISLLSAILAVLALILGVYILFTDPKKLVHKLFFLMMMLISYWNFICIGVFSAESREGFIFLYKMCTPAIYIVPTSLFIVMLIVRLNRKIIVPVLSVIYLEYTFLFIYQFLNLELIYKDFVKINGYWNFIWPDAGLIPILYKITFLFLWLVTMILLINWYRKTPFLREKKQAKVLFISSGLLFLFLFVEYFIYGFFSNRDLGLSAIYQFIWPLGIGISIIKYGFLSFTPGLYSHDVFENIEESVLVLDYNKKILFANSNAKKLISGDIAGSDLIKFISGYDEIIADIDSLLNGSTNNFTANIAFAKDDNAKFVFHARFSIIRDKYNDRIGVLIIGQELKGVKEFSAEYKITERELDVIRSLATGISNRDMAIKLHITERTIKAHLLNIYEKLNIKNRVELIHVLKKYGLA